MRFERADIAGNACFDKATFSGDSSFVNAKVAGQSLFKGTRFGNRTDKEDKISSFEDARFEGFVHFGSTIFENNVTFQDTSFRVVSFSESGLVGSEKQFQSNVDLRGCTYDRINGKWQSLLKHLEPYDRQPYTQLEKVFRAAGKDRQADEVYLARKRSESGRIERRGDFFRWVSDRLYREILNYGVRPFRLVLFAILLLGIGTYALCDRNAAIPKDPKINHGQEYRGELWDAAALSVNQFLPVELPWGSQWKPSHKNCIVWMYLPCSGWHSFDAWFSFSALSSVLLTIPGWILVPLAVTAFAGLLRRKGS